MNFFLINSIYLLLTINLYQCLEGSDKNMENEINCRERNRLITTDRGDIYMLVDAVCGKKLILQCHYCKENDNSQPKIWYKIKNLTKLVAEEVKLGMDSNTSLNRIFVNEKHSLIFRNVTLNDTGFYYCLGLDQQESENKYSYLVDTTYEMEAQPEACNLTGWLKYHDEVFLPLNKLFASSSSQTFEYIRKQLFINIEVATEWERWGLCEVCGRPKGEGQRRKRGFCRIKMTSTKKNKTVIPKNKHETIFLNAYELSCRSQTVGKLFPEVSNLTRFLPQFIQFEKCDGICNPDAEGLSKGWKVGKTKEFKYKKSFVLAENAHLTLVCPESTLDNVVSWYKNGKLLKSGESVQSESGGEPRITVDTFNTLYLHGVTSEEEGNYTCQVDDIRMQQIRIYIVSKSRLLTQAFFRHMIYLAFVLSLTFSCYCAGLFVTWKKRSTFKTYEELRKSEDTSEENTISDEEDVDENIDNDDDDDEDTV